jgi:hypothetical protein
LTIDKIRGRFPWHELIRADGGYNAGHAEVAVAKMPVMHMEILKRSDDMEGSEVLPRCGWLGASSRGLDETGVSPRTSKTKPKPSFVTLASIQIGLGRPART